MAQVWKRDWGLTTRIIITGLLLLLIYLAFMAVLWYFNVSIGLILLFVFVMAFAQYFFSDSIVLMSTKTKIVSETEAPELHQMIERICADAGVPKPRIGIMPSPMANAFATGRSPKRAVVAVTDTIMRVLNTNELEAVLAHEIAHVKNRDVLALTLASFIAMVASMIVHNILFISFTNRGEGSPPWILIAIVAGAVWLISTILMLALSRYREYAADRGSAYITNDPMALVSALKKISGTVEAMPSKKRQEVEGANAFYIIPAISGKSIMSLFATHPPLEKRIANLEKILVEQRGY
ncbi:MAG: zinc metalloprotease HtpX [Methanomicrobiales archaeon]|jgi:heat shock protein HtpX|nr:zinc metalloprotease HtpX [Methanomicrobiales archaeon]